ncbi:P-loop containing nucleoside triphosphate hydrolase [Pseudocohnilembus persalinus]|uniref:p-loop containing nucleoside triphosphate hydrolase n=1 Tax=Pseudocohnilembus persalinus TaxID=266149 RepID=A0A0V0QZF5_PSEPJ|nr:P-loop containing nucleoside triphosphate hydrolase [Pseudocohnilembus persalinus]|eukprot:KRX07585.1 P-loop containing nucleoside triphosphate hydrolase [Pseudocohnilembus persalinus]
MFKFQIKNNLVNLVAQNQITIFQNLEKNNIENQKKRHSFLLTAIQQENNENEENSDIFKISDILTSLDEIFELISFHLFLKQNDFQYINKSYLDFIEKTEKTNNFFPFFKQYILEFQHIVLAPVKLSDQFMQKNIQKIPNNNNDFYNQKSPQKQQKKINQQAKYIQNKNQSPIKKIQQKEQLALNFKEDFIHQQQIQLWENLEQQQQFDPSLYVQGIQCAIQQQNQENQQMEQSPHLQQDLMQHVEKFISTFQSQTQILIIEGDSGLGKSAFMQYLQHKLKFQEITQGVLKFNELKNLEQFQKQIQILIKNTQEQNCYLYLLDGFDEIMFPDNIDFTSLIDFHKNSQIKLIITAKIGFISKDPNQYFQYFQFQPLRKHLKQKNKKLYYDILQEDLLPQFEYLKNKIFTHFQEIITHLNEELQINLQHHLKKKNQYKEIFQKFNTFFTIKIVKSNLNHHIKKIKQNFTQSLLLKIFISKLENIQEEIKEFYEQINSNQYILQFEYPLFLERQIKMFVLTLKNAKDFLELSEEHENYVFNKQHNLDLYQKFSEIFISLKHDLKAKILLQEFQKIEKKVKFVEILPFSKQQQKEYTEKYIEKNKHQKIFNQQQYKDEEFYLSSQQYIEKLNQNPEILEIAKNPLILTVSFQVFP